METGEKDGEMREVSAKEMDLTGQTIIMKNPYPVLSALKNTADEE